MNDSAITILYNKLISSAMKAIYMVRSEETGTVYLKRRKIARALRWWLRENGLTFQYRYFFQ